MLQRSFLPDAERRDAQSAALASNWWMVACRGVLALALGLVQRLGVVRVATDTAPWPPAEFWIDIGFGFMLAGATLLAAAPGLNVRYGRLWFIAAGIVLAAAGILVMMSSSSTEYAWVGDMLTSAAGALLLVLALQLLARNKEREGRA